MNRLADKQILVAITGGIAAYKAAELVRTLVRAGARVRVIMTEGAQAFITPLTLQALSGYPVHTDLLDPEAEQGMGHIELARWAERIVVAPASANSLARLADGQADDLLTTVCLASKAPLLVAPAMNQQMWQAQATQENIATLQRRGVTLIGPARGEQACGDVGLGRMEEPDVIAQAVAESFATSRLSGQHVVITAGPTREAIDPVRYISNHSSGKMGFALARAALDAGARVTLISGPVHLATPDKARRIDVTSAQQMYEAAMAIAPETDIFIATAAVADYRPVHCADQKIKKTREQMVIELARNPDIVASIAALPEKPFVVGFAAETRDVETYGRDKLERKKLDMIACNDVSQQDIGFNAEENALQVFWPDGQATLPQASKALIAEQLITLIGDHFNKSKA